MNKTLKRLEGNGIIEMFVNEKGDTILIDAGIEILEENLSEFKRLLDVKS